jgi:hypothetical protein
LINAYSELAGDGIQDLFPPATAAEDPGSLEPMNIGGLGERILVVEDETMVRDFSLRALEKYGYRVVAVSTVQEALSVFETCGPTADESRSGSPTFDMVFTDVVLPDGSGLAMLDRAPDPTFHQGCPDHGTPSKVAGNPSRTKACVSEPYAAFFGR